MAVNPRAAGLSRESLVVENFDSFADAITRKLITEIAGAPPNLQSAALD